MHPPAARAPSGAGPSRRALWCGLAGLIALLLGSLFIPLEIPAPAVPSRVYGRPHLVRVGQGFEATGLEDRLRRLGYRQIRRGTPAAGEFRFGPRRVQIHARSFEAAGQKEVGGIIEVRLDARRHIQTLRSPRRGPLRGFLLEPERIGTFKDPEHADRYLTPLEDLPAHLIDAVLEVEDRRFFEHVGFDLRRVAGALLANLRAGRIREGGSTLTQQLAKNLFLTHERTLLRKLREAWLALRLERSHSKKEILEAYLNTIYLGQRGSRSVRGIEASARHYFGKAAMELDLAESALLAGLIRGPGLYSPFRDPTAARARRDQVLAILRERGRIPEEVYDDAVALPLGTLPKPVEPVSAPYFVATIQRQLNERLPDLEPEGTPVLVYTGLDPQLQIYARRAVQRGLERLERNHAQLIADPQPLQAALIALDPRTGDVLAHVGGREWGASQFDRATQARRQPGSVFKAVVALAALARGDDGTPPFTLASLLDDEELSLETPQGEWTPTNYSGSFRGRLSLRVAVEDSINVPIARVGLALGPEKIVKTARRMGIRAPLSSVPSLALGASELSPLEVAEAYAVFASEGQRVGARMLRSVTDTRGLELARSSVRTERAFDPAEIALVTSVLRGAVAHGTARSLRRWGFRGPVAGKTGTTNEFRDAWFAAYTPDIVVAVWVGFDDGRSLGLTGASAALPIFADFMLAAFGEDGGSEFDTPPGVEFARIHQESGLRAAFGCWGDREIFLQGTAPRESCGGWFVSARSERRIPLGEPPQVQSGGEPLDRLLGLFTEIIGDLLEEIE